MDFRESDGGAERGRKGHRGGFLGNPEREGRRYSRSTTVSVKIMMIFLFAKSN